MSVRFIMYFTMPAAFATLALLGCAGNNAVATSPIPTSPPVFTTCHGSVVSNNADRRFTITTATQRSVRATAAGKNRLTISPATIALSPAHPTATMTISEPGYRGPFSILFNNGQCADISVFFHRRLAGRAIATFEI